MLPELRKSGSWAETRGGASRRCPKTVEQGSACKLAHAATALCMGMLIAPSAFAEALSERAAVALAGTVADVNTQASGPTGPTAQVELESVVPILESTAGTTARQYRADDAERYIAAPELRARVWWGTPMAGLGTGADLVSTAGVPGLRPLRPVLGVRANMSERTRVIYEVRGPAASAPSVPLPGAGDQEARLALEFRKAKSPAQDLRNGLFRVQLSNSSSWVLKPRKGGLLVSYRSQF